MGIQSRLIKVVAAGCLTLSSTACLGDFLTTPGGSGRPPGTMKQLVVTPGARETRWAHLLAGEPPAEHSPAEAHAAVQEPSLGEIAALKANVDRLEGEVAELREKLARVYRELGL